VKDNKEEGMDKKLGRRKFLKEGLFFGVASAAGARGLGATGLFKRPRPSQVPDLAVVTGPDYGLDAVKAVEMLGGMKKFVAKGAKVALLPNSQSPNPGTFTKPEILKSVIQMCRDAGASEINVLSWLNTKHWDRSGLGQVVKDAGANLILVERKDENFQSVPVPKGVALKEAAIMKEFYRHDVLIDMPITKDHSGNRFTGTLKNFMGLNSPGSNRAFHIEDADPKAGKKETDLDVVEHLDQCIADLNTVIAPNLCIVDATEYIITNGPFGPGEIQKSQKVIAGTDRVAIDGYCTTLRGMKPTDIIMIRKAYEHGLGEIDLSKVKIIEAKA
jgi:uncharacterized protein (DUF362 family)